MFILINGSFGVGKSTVARQLRRRRPGSIIFDPEWVGLTLHRLPCQRAADFQDIPGWRRLSVRGARLFGLAYPVVIVPMAFTNLSYLREIRGGLEASGRPVHHFCLTAPLEVVRARLEGRGEPQGDPRHAWVHRRAAECCEAHQGPAFAEQVDTADRSVDEVVGVLLERLSARL